MKVPRERDIQAHLAHASIQTTLDRYGHLMPEVNQEAAKGLEAVLFGVKAAGAEPGCA